ncbi:MAG TPA: hypothetical protein VK364_04725 [Hymenobacter sp.]|nr:hypothetical protein [Hymenobacter sp.]
MNRTRFAFLTFIAIALVSSALPLSAQAQSTNQAAVDTLTKDVAMAVLGNQQGDKATEIMNQLSMCGDGCDAVSIIKNVGGWDAVGVKMEELGRLKNTAKFQAMSSGEANATIRRELARFYGRHKRDKNYGVPLGPDVQARMLAKIDGMLPPAAAPQLAPAVAGKPTAGQDEPADAVDENGNIDPKAIQISRLQREVKEARSNKIWMIILSAIAGLLVGAGVVYFMLYRALKKEVDRLTTNNDKLSRELDAARRPKIANEPRQPKPENRQRQETYAPPRPEPPNSPAPVDAKPVAEPVPVTPLVIHAETPVAGAPVLSEPVIESKSIPEPVQTQSQSSPAPTVSSARSEVFYFPPPDPNGQFDNAHRSDTLSPESAYRFSTNPETPDLATFRFEAEPGRVARFLTYRNYMIEPACDSENSFSSTYTRIAMRRDGEAVLENGHWRVKTKALIRYE